MPIIPDLPKAETAIVEMTNEFRREHKLAELKPDPTLAKAAREFARFLAASTIFSHEADGRRPSDRIKAAGYAACTTAENLAWLLDSRGFETRDLAFRMVDGWKNSPPHRKNLMLEHVTETGVAIHKVTGAEKYVSVQLFGRPLSMQYQVEVENRAGRKVAYTLGGKRLEAEVNTLVRHTVCDPGEIVFEVKPGGLLAKAETMRFEARGGSVYKLGKDASGKVRVEAAASEKR